MYDKQTAVAAKEWVATGVNWIENGSYSLGVKNLERAIPVFLDRKDTVWLTYARHHLMVGTIAMGSHEQVLELFEEVMAGYVELEFSYGKALALLHAAQSQDRRGRWQQALSLLNLAISIATWARQGTLQAYLLGEKARLYLERQNMVDAIRALRESERLFEEAKEEDEALHRRVTLAEALARLGERSEAQALLEDAQGREFRAKKYRQALLPLRLLMRLYEEGGMLNEKERVAELIHFAGQYILQHQDAGSPRPDKRYPVMLAREDTEEPALLQIAAPGPMGQARGKA
ncbi:MAG: hypothetical protein OEV94_08510 [Deltaproteobacteria bacterium]|nr:hypothetical protein [Deltaproteobacteria bacterium]